MAPGSQKVWAGWEPRVCRVCGTKLTHKTGGCFHYPADAAPYSTCTTSKCISIGAVAVAGGGELLGATAPEPPAAREPV